MQTKFLFIASILAALAVMTGAFGAHGLESHLPPDQLQTWETAVQYQFYHSFGLFVVAFLMSKFSTSKLLRAAGILFIIGIFLFSGSLYLLACKNILSLPLALIGPLTPLGGLCFIIAWVLIAINVLRSKDKT